MTQHILLIYSNQQNPSSLLLKDMTFDRTTTIVQQQQRTIGSMDLPSHWYRCYNFRNRILDQ